MLGPILAGTGIDAPPGLQGSEGDVVLRQSVQELIEAVQFNSMHPVQELIKRIVPEFQPTTPMPDPSILGQVERKEEVSSSPFCAEVASLPAGPPRRAEGETGRQVPPAEAT